MARSHWIILGAACVCLAAGVALGDSMGIRALAAIAGVAALVWVGLKQAESLEQVAESQPEPPPPIVEPTEPVVPVEAPPPKPVPPPAMSEGFMIGEGDGKLEVHSDAL
jgi:hypothetical protein